MSKRKIGIIVGSARKASFCQSIAREAVTYLPDNYEVNFLEIKDLPLFNQDYDDEGTTPESWKEFRKQVEQMDAYLFFTPEYNRSFPPLLKNALDIASRPHGQNQWSGKPGAVVGVSPGAMGAFGSCQHLRQVLAFLNILIMNQPEAYINDVAACLDENGKVTARRTQDFLKKIMEAYVNWVEGYNHGN